MNGASLGASLLVPTNTRTPYARRGQGLPSGQHTTKDDSKFTMVTSYVIYRHGSRGPKDSTAIKMNQAARWLQSNTVNRITKANRHRLQAFEEPWSDVVFKGYNQLNQIGKEEMTQLAVRYREHIARSMKEAALPAKGPLPDDTSVTEWVFFHSSTSRTEQSAAYFERAFRAGSASTLDTEPLDYYSGIDEWDGLKSSLLNLFDPISSDYDSSDGDSFDMHLENHPADSDYRVDKRVRHLKPYAACNAWADYVKSESTKQWVAKRWAVIDNRIRDSFSDLLQGIGLDPATLDVGRDLVPLYDLCSFSWAGSETPPSICQLFTMKDLQLLEYRDDIENYVNYSHGDEYIPNSAIPQINHRLSWPLLDYLYQAMKRVTKEHQEQLQNPWPKKPVSPRSTFYFAHARLIMLLLTTLHLYKDDVFSLVDPTEQQILGRRFISSAISPMAANIGFELWYHESGSYHLRFTHNEQVVVPEYEACNAQSGYCKFEELFKEIRSKYELNFDKSC
ncbi:PHOsphatase [Tieghemiomyces parasiticus]|uniref:Multiple inositol polyphosphate phosphatase 1 n=1 Tax=Tieghemiomyces parasiticus TaxID=78921 RepID=A0A9W8AEE7_9FUNG|nr:PHOsphatase [Tieghemiomyces parasiticus]